MAFRRPRRPFTAVGFGGDTGRAYRRLLASPAFTIFTIITLAIGIGSATAVFSLTRDVLGPPSGVPDAHRLLEIRHTAEGSLTMMNLAWEDYQDLRSRQTAFENLTAWVWFRPALVLDGETLSATGEIVDGSYFQTVRPRLHLGRLLSPADDRPSAAPVAVISFSLWRRFFASDPGVINRSIRISGTTVTIVGVTGEDFAGLFSGGLLPTSVWIPMATARIAVPQDLRWLAPGTRDHRWLFVRGRLAAGRSVDDGLLDVRRIARQLDREYPIGRSEDPGNVGAYAVSRLWVVRPADSLTMGIPDRVTAAFNTALLSSVGLVMLVACTNLANLMAARHSRRRASSAIRVALGASKSRIAWEAMTEPLLLTVAGGVAGLVVAHFLMVILSFEVPLGNGLFLQALPSMDLAVFSAAIGAMALTLAVAGVVPAIGAVRAAAGTNLALSGPGASPRWRGRSYLIAAHVSVSVVLIAIALFFAARLGRQSRADTGVDLDRLAIAVVDFEAQRYPAERARQVAEAARTIVSARPDTEVVAITSGLPFSVGTDLGRLLIQRDATTAHPVNVVAGDATMFPALGVQITRGRPFDQRDSRTSRPVVIINHLAATAAFGTADPIGQPLLMSLSPGVNRPARPPVEMMVVGLASDTDASSPGFRQRGVAYLPLDQYASDTLLVVARTSTPPADTVPGLHEALRSVDRQLVVRESGTGMELAGPGMLFPMLMASLAASLGMVALVLALAGLHGVLSYVVAGRTREIAIRLALGSSPARIRRDVVVEGIRPVAIGLFAGLGAAAAVWAATRAVWPVEPPPLDLAPLAIVPLLFIAAGIAATYLPARRASSVDPNAHLKSQ